jgi:hypothetical protein
LLHLRLAQKREHRTQQHHSQNSPKHSLFT